MDPTRLRILTIMKTRQRISARELARALQVTPANIRHHLRRLEAEGLVRRTGQQLIEGRGRPAALYAPVHPVGNLGGLVKRLLEKAADDPGSMADLAARLAPEPPQIGRHVTQRLVGAMGALAPLGYRPRWEPHPDGPQIVFANCPYAEIIADHPELCGMDAHLLERLVGLPARQVDKLERNNEGTLLCRFVLGRGD